MKPGKTLTRMITGAAVGTLLALGVGVMPAQAQTQVSTEARDLFNMTNNVRSAYGLNKLTLDTALTDIAQNWSETQARENRMYHRPNFAGGYPAGWRGAAENVVSGHKSISAQVFFDAWMNSAGHKTNILGNYSHIGIGWAGNGTNNYGTQNFGLYNGNPSNPIDPNGTPTVNNGFNHRIGVISDGQYFVKEGAFNAGWTTVWNGNVKSVAVTQNRIGVLLNNGDLLVKEGGVNAGWVQMGSGITEFALAGNRIGVVSNGTAKVKEGSLYAYWLDVRYNARDIVLNDNRIGVITTDHTLHVKEGSLNAGWVTMAHHVKDVVLTEKRVGIQDAVNTLYVKEGALNAGWTNVANSISTFDLSGNRIGVVQNGTTFVKEGAVNAGWVTLEYNTKSVDLSGNRIVVVKTDNQAQIKEGSLYAGWANLANGVTAVDMNNS